MSFNIPNLPPQLVSQDKSLWRIFKPNYVYRVSFNLTVPEGKVFDLTLVTISDTDYSPVGSESFIIFSPTNTETQLTTNIQKYLNDYADGTTGSNTDFSNITNDKLEVLVDDINDDGLEYNITVLIYTDNIIDYTYDSIEYSLDGDSTTVDFTLVQPVDYLKMYIDSYIEVPAYTKADVEDFLIEYVSDVNITEVLNSIDNLGNNESTYFYASKPLLYGELLSRNETLRTGIPIYSSQTPTTLFLSGNIPSGFDIQVYYNGIKIHEGQIINELDPTTITIDKSEIYEGYYTTFGDYPTDNITVDLIYSTGFYISSVLIDKWFSVLSGNKGQVVVADSSEYIIENYVIGSNNPILLNNDSYLSELTLESLNGFPNTLYVKVRHTYNGIDYILTGEVYNGDFITFKYVESNRIFLDTFFNDNRVFQNGSWVIDVANVPFNDVVVVES